MASYVASSYGDADLLERLAPHHLADLGALPAKMFPELLLDNQESQHREGTRTYVRYLKWTARYC